MRRIEVENYADWRKRARSLLAAGEAPQMLQLCDPSAAQADLFASAAPTALRANACSAGATRDARVPRRFLAMARLVAQHRDPSRWQLLYRLLWRLCRVSPELLEDAADRDVATARALADAVRRDAHKTKAFVRFCRLEDDVGERWVAWHRAEHRVLPLVAPFFAERFAAMRWMLMTPDESVAWDGQQLRFGPGAPRSRAPAGDELDALWRTYYAATFNPARLNLTAMRTEMPKKHWSTLPEAPLIPKLVQQAQERTTMMLSGQPSARDFLPAQSSLPLAQQCAASCRGCELFAPANQTVFGEGSAPAALMLVGEQPGDEEDLAGRPFVGPSGRVLDTALAAAGIDRSAIYVTNAVKHFKFSQRGKRRLHQRPDAGEIERCRPWLELELELVRPQAVVALGQSAALSLLGRRISVSGGRGLLYPGPRQTSVTVTWHPAAILRAGDDPRRLRELAADLRRAAEHLA